MHSKIIKDYLHATSLLRAGKLVSFPTETVYGLGADTRNLSAVAKVFTLKQRPVAHPLIVHIASIDYLTQIASEIPAYAYRLAAAFWPGPLTLVLKKQPQISYSITGGQETVAVRVPDHKLAQQLLSGFALGLVGPSANRFGRISPTSASDVIADLGSEDLLTAVLDGGLCTIGIESTIVDCTQAVPRILRHGHIHPSQLAQVLDLPLAPYSANTTDKVSGNLKSHYAPLAQAFTGSHQEILALLKALPTCKLAVLSLHAAPVGFRGSWINEQNDPTRYAKNLYANLRKLDQSAPDYILIEEVANGGYWLGVYDRVKKATSQARLADLLSDKTFAHG